MVGIEIEYQGSLRCLATHGPSGRRLETDAPLDNQGRGESFSPTDLVATALGTCILTTMGIVAQRHGWDLSDAKVSVVKVMVSQPHRRIGRLEVLVRIPGVRDERARRTLEATALTCPVHRSLREEVEIPLRFEWAGAGTPG
jgi:putative redox protein